MNYRFWLFLGVVFIASSSQAQYDVSELDLGKDVTKWFDHTIGGENLPILSGSYQEVRNNSRLTHRFFESNKWSEVIISYFGQEYDQLSGLYDVLDGNLLLQHPTYTTYFSQPLKVQQDKIQSFLINGHLFKYYSNSEAPGLGKGFYDQLLLRDHLSLIAKRKKEETVSTNDAYMDYKVIDAYFLKYKGNYTRIKGRRSLIKALIEYKKPLRQFIRQNLLMIRVGNDEDLIALLDYCDQLINDQ